MPPNSRQSFAMAQQRWYSYEARDPQGRTVSGQVQSTTLASARRTLALQNLEVVHLETSKAPPVAEQNQQGAALIEQASRQVDAAQRAPELIARASLVRLRRVAAWNYSLQGLLGLRKSVSSREKAVFLCELAAMLDAGFPLAHALHCLLQNQTEENVALREAVRILHEGILHPRRDGEDESSPLLRSLRECRLFTSLELARLSVAEVNGDLPACFRALARDLQSNIRLRQQALGKLIHPIAVSVVTWLLFPLLLLCAARTQAAFAGSSPTLLQTLAQPGILFLWWAGPPLALFLLSRVDAASYLRYIPPVAQALHHYRALLATRALAEMLETGVSLTEALPLTGGIALREDFERVLTRVQNEGMPLARALDGVLPPLLVQMTEAGEQSGATGRLMMRGVDILEQELFYRLGLVVQVLEPILLMVVGTLVGLVCLASLKPIAQLVNGL